MTSNLIPYAPIFCAVGAKLNLNTRDYIVTVAEYPKGRKQLIDAAIDDISKFLDTTTSEDTVSFFGFVDYIDEHENAIDPISRENLKEHSDCYIQEKYIVQEIAVLKTNKSWHSSEDANTCSHFGTLCTNRGIQDIKGKRGRKATRNPEEYHTLKSNGVIAREQLITPALEALCRAIPKEVTVSATKPKSTISYEELSNMKIEDIQALLERVKEQQKNG
jgi:hypothetical protein